QRYGSAAELAEDLDRYLAGRPIKARPISPWGRAAKWARRRPAAAALIGISSIALVALGVGLERYNAYERERVAGTRAAANAYFRDALRQQASREWNEAEKTLSVLLTKLDAEPRLADLSAEAQKQLGEVRRQIAVEEARAAAERAKAGALERFDRSGR